MGIDTDNRETLKNATLKNALAEISRLEAELATSRATIQTMQAQLDQARTDLREALRHLNGW